MIGAARARSSRRSHKNSTTCTLSHYTLHHLVAPNSGQGAAPEKMMNTLPPIHSAFCRPHLACVPLEPLAFSSPTRENSLELDETRFTCAHCGQSLNGSVRARAAFFRAPLDTLSNSRRVVPLPGAGLLRARRALLLPSAPRRAQAQAGRGGRNPRSPERRAEPSPPSARASRAPRSRRTRRRLALGSSARGTRARSRARAVERSRWCARARVPRRDAAAARGGAPPPGSAPGKRADARSDDAPGALVVGGAGGPRSERAAPGHRLRTVWVSRARELSQDPAACATYACANCISGDLRGRRSVLSVSYLVFFAQSAA